MINCVNLESEGLPNYNFYEDGRIVNITTGKILTPGPTKSRNLQLWCNNKRHNVNLSILYRRYFDSELMHIPREYVANLAFCGLSKYSVTYFGKIWTHATESWLAVYPAHNGYVQYKLVGDDGTWKSVSLHILVAKAFVPNPYGYDQVDHIDGNKLNNCATNLEWVNGLINVKRAQLKGLRPMAITDDEVEFACEKILDGWTDTEIAKKINVSSGVIHSIRAGYTHREISSKYGIGPNEPNRQPSGYYKYKKDHTKYKHYTPKISTLI